MAEHCPSELIASSDKHGTKMFLCSQLEYTNNDFKMTVRKQELGL